MSKSTQESRLESQESKPAQSPKTSNQSSSNANNLFDAWENSISQYRQAIENFQLECVRSCKKMYNSSISAQQEFARKNGVSYPIPDATQKIISDSVESAEKLIQAQSRAVSESFATVTNNIKAINENTKPFAEVCNSVTDLWNPSWFERQ